eukprot:170242-Chlamydomonas_euryale.AAC.2
MHPSQRTPNYLVGSLGLRPPAWEPRVRRALDVEAGRLGRLVQDTTKGPESQPYWATGIDSILGCSGGQESTCRQGQESTCSTSAERRAQAGWGGTI